MIFFKSSVVTLDCFTYSRAAFELFKLESGVQYLPEWWKKLPRSHSNGPWDINPTPTMKKCPGMVNLYSKGFVLPMWSDLNVRIEKDGGGFQWQFSDCCSNIISHPLEVQAPGWLGEKYFNLKFSSPWAIDTKSDVNFIMVAPQFNYKDFDRLTLVNGIVDFKHQHALNANFIAEFKSFEQILEYKAGEPLAMVLPLSDKKIKLKMHLIGREEWDQKNLGFYSFNNTFGKTKKILSRRK